MESAIAAHLVCRRTRPARRADGYSPPYPAHSARFDAGVERVVIANFGVQWRDPADAAAGLAYAARLSDALGPQSSVAHVDLARYRDEAGFDTLVLLTYWTDLARYDAWWEQAKIDAKLDASPNLGTFCEVLTPDLRRVETLYSAADMPEGIGCAAPGMSGEVAEHAYWGSARDRLPAAQIDALASSGVLGTVGPAGADGSRTVRGHDNIAIIRSGQNWGNTSGLERELYLNQIEPTLRAGMDFLRDSGGGIGCYFNRYMRLADHDGQELERSFGWSYWRSLADLEAWAEHHPTHLEIFGTFNRVVVELEFQLDLRLSHEIYVVTADEQFYQYRNCHDQTGFLKPLNAEPGLR